jgi:hypothetical protein
VFKSPAERAAERSKREPGLATPSAVRYASYLMRAGAALQAAAAVTALLTDRLAAAVMFGIFSLIAITFWLWTARAARQAEPGIPSSAVIMLTWATLLVLKWWQFRSEPLPVIIIFTVECLAGLGATALLFGKGSTAYFRQYRADGRLRRWVTARLPAPRRHPST